MNEKSENTEITRDSLFDGDIICYQSRYGYRFSIDSVLLAHFCQHWKNATVLDMGCGNGILGLILLYRNGTNIKKLIGIEYQHNLALLGEKNIKENKLDNQFEIVQGDLKKIDELIPAESFSHLICNPPFYTIGKGRPSTRQETYLARHQVEATPVDIARAISYSIKNKGTAALVYPADQIVDLFQQLTSYRIEPKIIQLVYSYPASEEAILALVECIKNGGSGVKIKKPLYIYTKKNGSYSQDVEAMYIRNIA